MDFDINAIHLPPRILEAKRVLVVSPHPDDAQLGAGGTLARLLSLGAEVWELTATDDRFSIPGYTWHEGDPLTPRQQESVNAQNYMGMKNAGFLGFRDKTTADVPTIGKEIAAVIRRIRPDLVLTVDPTNRHESHCDHVKVGNAVRFACLDCDCRFYPDFIDGQLRHDQYIVSAVGYFHTDAPNTLVDITAFKETKMKSIEFHHVNEPELMASLQYHEEYFGKKAGVHYAEAFRLQGYHQFHCFSLPLETLIF